MKRAKSLKYKISMPFLFLIILFPLALLLLFNITIHIYINSTSKIELKTVSKTVEAVLKKELAGNLLNFNIGTNSEANAESNAEALDKVFAKLYKTLRVSKIKNNTDILLYTQRGELLYPRRDNENDTDTNQLTGRLTKRITKMQANKVYSLREGGQRYFVLSYPLTGAGNEQYALVFIAHTDQAEYMMKTVNGILIAIMLAGIVLAVLTANRLSAKITKPVTELCSVTKAIGKGNFTQSMPQAPSDIQELQQLYDNIGEMAGRLEQYDKSQKTFLQNASHELRTPLMSIQGYAEGIAGGVLTDVKSAAGVIASESVRLNKLVEELLTLSRIESQTYQKELVPMNLGDTLKEYAQRLGGFASKQERQLNLTVPDTPVRILADDTLLSQAVINIASNCLRYSKTGATIELQSENNKAVIRISDDGGGIPEDDLPHIFERFYKAQGGNFGLGLAIAKSAVEVMKGNISAYNSLSGAVFEIVLPRWIDA